MVAFSHIFSAVAVATSAFSSTWAFSDSPVHAPFPRLEPRQTDNRGPFAITGVTQGGNAQRQEIRTVQSNPNMFNLLILAMERFMKQPETSEESYYQIAGIHGVPFVAWDGAEREGNGGGYCTHASNLFGTWHRPYLALFEQVLQSHAVSVANSFPGQQRDMYRSLAAQLRLPYWDWAERGAGPVLPSAFTNPTVQVTRPNGSRRNIPNPLFAYTFHPIRRQDFNNQPPYSTWSTTKRAATSGDPNAQSQNGQVEASLAAGMGGIRNRVYNLFTKGEAFNRFSNKGNGQRTGDNLESIHDVIHGNFGGYSHMSFPQYAAFDPIFWFHHANIDRIEAMWQALYPQEFVTPARQPGGTFTFNAGSIQTADSPLKPFHRDNQGNYHTSNGVRDINVFHYSYPELADNPSKNVLRQRINRLYAPQASGVNGQLGRTRRGLTLNSTAGLNFTSYRNSSQLLEYGVEITMPINPFGSTYSVAVFLGDFDLNPTTWASQPNFVCEHTSMPIYTGINIKSVTTATIPLTEALLRKEQLGEIESLDKDSVDRYLRKNLHWRAQASLNPIKRLQVAGLRVKAISTHVKPAPDKDSFPVFNDVKVVPHVTDYSPEDPPYTC